MRELTVFALAFFGPLVMVAAVVSFSWLMEKLLGNKGGPPRDRS